MATVNYRGGPTRVSPKDPDSVLDYQFNWSEWLGDDTIASSTWEVPNGITKDSDTNDDTSATIWLSGGTVNETYEVTNRVVTAAGRTQDRTMIVPVQEM